MYRAFIVDLKFPIDMMAQKQKATLWTVATSLVLIVVTGCGSSSPGVKKAQTALEEQDYERALTNVETALEEDSTDTVAFLLRATILREQADSTMTPDKYTGLHQRAWEAEEQALSIDGGLRETVQSRRAEVYGQEWTRGTLAYNRANKNQREELYRQAVSFFGAAGIVQADSARPLLNEAFARLRMGERKAVIPVLEKYVERAETPKKKAYKVLGQLYMERDNRAAIDLLDKATRDHPDDQELQALRLNAYNRAGVVDQALAAYRDQIKRRPNNAMYRYNYGALLLEAERYTGAIAQLDSAVALRPSHVGSQYNLGAAYVNAALARDDSIAALEGGQDVTRSDTTGRQERIDALAKKRERFFQKAIPPLERARKMSTAGSTLRQDACRALMVAYVQTGRPNRAAQVESCTGFTTPNAR